MPDLKIRRDMQKTDSHSKFSSAYTRTRLFTMVNNDPRDRQSISNIRKLLLDRLRIA